jgi:hypothetical protein
LIRVLPEEPFFQAVTRFCNPIAIRYEGLRSGNSAILHPPLLDEAGLASAARWYAEGFSKRSGIQVKLDLPSGSGRLPNDVEMVLFRVIQESLVNVHRHSGASIVDIALKQTPQVVIMEVHDDGRGIAPKLLDRLRTTHANGGVGLAGMWERVNDLNGKMEIESSSAGTTLRSVCRWAAPSCRCRRKTPVKARGGQGKDLQRLPDTCCRRDGRDRSYWPRPTRYSGWHNIPY